MNFMNLPEEYRKENSKFKILPIKYEKDLTFGDGASKGPVEIIKASKQLEYYDEQFNCEAFEDGIFTCETLDLNKLTPEEAFQKIKVFIPRNSFVLSLGGDHSITFPVIDKLFEKEDFSVIVLDAHSDMRHSWNNSRLNHACVSKRISERTNIGIIGVRSQDIDEAKEISKSSYIFQIKAHNYSKNKLNKLLGRLKDKVYISIDVDVFDPSFIRNTGTPEPGGFFWNEVINILKTIFEKKEVIGADIVEFAPKENYKAESYSLAKLAYKIMCLKKRKEVVANKKIQPN